MEGTGTNMALEAERLLRRAFVTLGTVVIASLASAQYEVRQWANFEDMKLPADAITIGKNPQETLKIIDPSKVADLASGFKQANSVKEIGKGALELQSMPTA